MGSEIPTRSHWTLEQMSVEVSFINNHKQGHNKEVRWILGLEFLDLKKTGHHVAIKVIR